MTLIIVYIGLLVFLNTVGQLLLKNAALQGSGFKSPCLWVGYFCFCITIGVSFLLMKKMELKYFTIIMSLNYTSVILTSAYYFKEKLTLEKISGVTVVIAGIFVFMLDIFYVH